MSTIEQRSPAPDTRRPEAPTRVLIVDDAASARRLLRAVLEYGDEFEVVGEADGAVAAIEMARRLAPDLVLLDLSMPLMDGAEALAHLRMVAPHATVIILSGRDVHVAPELVRAGATAFIPKGLPPLALLAIIRRHLQQSIDATTTPRGTWLDVLEPPRNDPSVTPPRAVVCDDDPIARHLVGQVLETCDVSVIAETDLIPNLLAIVGPAQPELVILDLWLEGTPGTAALPEIRKASPRTVVVYSSFEEWRNRALAGGAAAFVAKPHFQQLATAVRGLAAEPGR